MPEKGPGLIGVDGYPVIGLSIQEAALRTNIIRDGGGSNGKN